MGFCASRIGSVDRIFCGFLEKFLHEHPECRHSGPSVGMKQPIKQHETAADPQVSAGSPRSSQITALINAPIICPINRRRGLCFVFYVSAFTAAITVGGLFFMAVWPPKLLSLTLSSLHPSLPFILQGPDSTLIES